MYEIQRARHHSQVVTDRLFNRYLPLLEKAFDEAIDMAARSGDSRCQVDVLRSLCIDPDSIEISNNSIEIFIAMKATDHILEVYRKEGYSCSMHPMYYHTAIIGWS
jgi:hypothetical protein